MKDPEFKAEAEKTNLTIEPMSGAELDKVTLDMFNADPKAVDAVKSLMAP
jgi:hypothetical protein